MPAFTDQPSSFSPSWQAAAPVLLSPVYVAQEQTLPPLQSSLQRSQSTCFLTTSAVVVVLLCLGTDGAARGHWCLYKAKSSTTLILSAAFCLHVTQDAVCRQLESLYKATHSKAAALTFSFWSLDWTQWLADRTEMSACSFFFSKGNFVFSEQYSMQNVCE